VSGALDGCPRPLRPRFGRGFLQRGFNHFLFLVYSRRIHFSATLGLADLGASRLPGLVHRKSISVA